MKNKIPAFFLSLILGGSNLAAADLYICGDSIAADYSRRDPRPAYGWGEYLPALCKKGVAVHDLAIPGSSTKTWFDTGKWADLCAQLKPGDFVFIALAFNDGDAKNPAAFSTPGDFGQNLETMIRDVRAAKATPLLLTPTVVYRADAETNARHRTYADVVRKKGGETHCEVIELNALFREKIAEDPEKFFILKRTVPVPNWLDFDPVHLNGSGAELAAECIVRIVREKRLSAEVLFP
ncbi:MAG: GDSL-type esterase/lipase family protein [Victivallaceae bacterium]|nr:GDSL-type esterase/lipase family protein [Victivallaceae bacterium]